MTAERGRRGRDDRDASTGKWAVSPESRRPVLKPLLAGELDGRGQQSALARELGCSRQHVSRLIQRLREQYAPPECDYGLLVEALGDQVRWEGGGLVLAPSATGIMDAVDECWWKIEVEYETPEGEVRSLVINGSGKALREGMLDRLKEFDGEAASIRAASPLLPVP